jgi:regulator of replication initiation timing
MTERQMDSEWERVWQMIERLAELVTGTVNDLAEENAQLRAENAALRQQLDRSQE